LEAMWEIVAYLENWNKPQGVVILLDSEMNID
jgi:hypothetical protein